MLPATCNTCHLSLVWPPCLPDQPVGQMRHSSFDFPANLLSCDLFASSPHRSVHWAENRSTLCLLLGTMTLITVTLLWMWGVEGGGVDGASPEAQHCAGTTWSWDHCPSCFTNSSCLPAIFDTRLTRHRPQLTPQVSSLFPKQCDDSKPLRPLRAESLNIDQCSCPPMHCDIPTALKAGAH